jgi:dipeptidyl aminopeptidase/acylaminoacyl peptidase
MDTYGNNQIRLTNTAALIFDESPSFSPDGVKIAFTSNWELYKMDYDGNNQIRLSTNPNAGNYGTCFSPDGEKIVFTSQPNVAESNLEIYRVNADGSGPLRLTNNTALDWFASFSPDGTKIVFCSNRDGNLEIYIMDSDGNNQTRLTNNSASDMEPSFSPDGTKIVFVSSRDGNSEIYIMNADGSNQARLTNYIRGDGSPSFSPFAHGLGGLSVAENIKPQALTKPLLRAPKDGANITNTIRPTFEWQGVQGVIDYKIQLNQTFDTFTNPTRAFSKAVTQTEANQTNPAFAYAIHEFDEGLAAGLWYWRVLASPGTSLEAASDSWSFTIDPALTITGITNYPNPFNPNKERTAIRYRLGRDADEVKIRIYDITGALVTELEGSTQGESVNIWSKYNDIYWDGTNGRGDKVLNGIYPFEVVARSGDKSVSGRGKIAVLK